MNRQELIEKLIETQFWIEQMLSKIPEDVMIKASFQGERSVNDILAHIATWNWNGIEWIKSLAKGEKPLLPMEGHKIEERPQVFARLNDTIQNENLNKTVKEVLEDFQNSFETVMNNVEKLNEEHLNNEFTFEWITDPIPGWQIVAWRIMHAKTHGKQIEDWVQTL
ncbi:MAG: ClbS/DfsB family four-helix bundle protein [Candidatus Thorarchaeota archaeon]|nr:ClbS/DfsB family four-helix bundle protein [Candidatus Thorarchaeota archaeon]